MKRMKEHGVEWVYRTNVFYATTYRSWHINVRRIYCSKELRWRLFVDKGLGSGIGLSWKHQLYMTAGGARRAAIQMVDEREGKPEAVKLYAGSGGRQ